MVIIEWSDVPSICEPLQAPTENEADLKKKKVNREATVLDRLYLIHVSKSCKSIYFNIQNNA